MDAVSNRYNQAGGHELTADDEVNREELRLVALAAEGDRLAFDRLVLAHRDRIMTLCLRLLGDYHEGEDAAQETFVRVYHGLTRFKGQARFGTWVHRIAINVCRNRRRSWWRRMSRGAVRLDKPADTAEGSIERELSDTRMSPVKEFRRRRTVAAIKRALAALPLKQRELVVLRDVQGLSYEEITAVTGIAPGTVKSRIARARESLRRKLGSLD
jgi:RNA polymerase sigma-70 factor (ECF subfamily)